MLRGDGPVDRGIDHVVQAADFAGTPELDQGDVVVFAGLESDGCARGDVEVHAEGPAAVETQGAVDLVEVEVRAHLDRSITGVGDGQTVGTPTGVEFDLAVLGENLTRDLLDRSLLVCVRVRRRPDRVVNGDELLPIVEEPLDLQRADEVGDAWKHLDVGQDLRADRGCLRDADSVTSSLDDRIGNERPRLGVAQTQASITTSASELCCQEQQQAVFFLRGQVHCGKLRSHPLINSNETNPHEHNGVDRKRQPMVRSTKVLSGMQ